MIAINTQAAQAEATYRRQRLAEVYRERRVLRLRHPRDGQHSGR